MFVSRNSSVITRGRCLAAHALRHRPLAATTARTHRSHLSTSPRLAASRRNADFNSGFTGSYDPTLDSGRGPMFNKTTFGVPQFYPRDLKRRVDDYVVGQDRAKKTICSTIFNHYQNVRRRRQFDHEERNRLERQARQRLSRDRELHQRRREAAAHPAEGQQQPQQHQQFSSEKFIGGGMVSGVQRVPNNRRHPADLTFEDDFPGHYESARGLRETDVYEDEPLETMGLVEDPSEPQPVKIDKSNLLLIGPTGVGKTYILETLSKQINVPFSICDCNSFTQAGYIGQDVESCIERLLIEANYDINATEQGIVVLDEFDKIARRETTTGRDVGGEGVQQALLKLIEGTKVTINVKDNRSSRSSTPITSNINSSGSSSSAQASPPGGKVDQYTIDTTNILFVFCGAFVGLDKGILRRVSKPSVGFGGKLESRSTVSGSKQILPTELYSHLPHYNQLAAESFTPLDLTTPEDLQAFGFIPELIGRLHNVCALSPLSKGDLFRILTEPRNSLSAQYTALFETYPSRLRFTEKALYALAERAAASGTGARGLKMEMERVLAEPMFDAPTSYVLITEACVNGKEKALYWGKDGRFELDRRLEEEQINQPAAKQAPHLTFGGYREAGQSGG